MQKHVQDGTQREVVERSPRISGKLCQYISLGRQDLGGGIGFAGGEANDRGALEGKEKYRSGGGGETQLLLRVESTLKAAAGSRSSETAQEELELLPHSTDFRFGGALMRQANNAGSQAIGRIIWKYSWELASSAFGQVRRRENATLRLSKKMRTERALCSTCCAEHRGSRRSDATDSRLKDYFWWISSGRGKKQCNGW